MSLDARLLILDEPTSALSEAEIRHLFDVVTALKADGVTLIYISHKFDEVFEIAERVTVLRERRVHRYGRRRRHRSARVDQDDGRATVE